MRTAPPAASHCEAMSFATVDLPEPDGPTSATMDPGAIESVTPLSTGTSP